jgi:hypothetical protein
LRSVEAFKLTARGRTFLQAMEVDPTLTEGQISPVAI